MGLFSFLFGKKTNQQQQFPQIQSIYPQGAILKLQSGVLPTIQADKLILSAGEKCHFVDRAIIVTERKCRHSKRNGGSFRIFSGAYYHTGETVSVPFTEPEYTNGIFYITNKRIVFVAQKNGFDKDIKKLTAITPYSDGIELQCGDKTYRLLVPDGDVPKHVLDLIV